MVTSVSESIEQAHDDIERLFFIVGELAARYGYSIEQVAEMATAALRSRGPDALLPSAYTTILPEHVDFLSYMLTLWSKDEHYVDDMGHMIPVPEKGPSPSLEALYTQAASTTVPFESPLSCQQAIELLKLHKSIVLTEADRYVAPSVVFRSNTDDAIAILQQAGYLLDFAETIYFNLTKKKPNGSGRAQYTSTVRGFPASKLPLINRIIRQEGLAFLEDVDAVLVSERSKSLNSETEKKSVGVGVYYFERE